MKTKTEFKKRSWTQFKKFNIFQAVVVLLCLTAAPAPAQTFSVLHAFTGSDGAQPGQNLVLSEGMLYGTTRGTAQGAYAGTVFRMGTNGSNFTVLKYFGVAAGPNCLVLAGTTLYGGGNGGLFRLNTDGTGYVALPTPEGEVTGLVISGGTLYGTAFFSIGHSTVFKVNTDGSEYVVLHRFSGSDGDEPYSGVRVFNGALFGTTVYGGDFNYGTIFRLGATGENFAVLHSFSYYNWSYTGLAQYDGALYGTTGSGQGDTLFRIYPYGGFSTLRTFSTPEGVGSYGDLIVIGSKLFGTRHNYYSGYRGWVYRIDPDGNNYLVLHQFLGSDGDAPCTALVVAGDTLYGMTAYGGNNYTGVYTGMGTVFRLSIAPPSIRTPPMDQQAAFGAAADFTVQADGFEPLSYQWLFNSTNTLSGATNAILHLANLQPFQAGAYTVVVTNEFGTVTSAPAILEVVAGGPTIQASPTNRTASIGGTATLSVAAGGTLPLSYQWFFNTTNLLAGATQPVLLLTNAQPAQTGFYTVVVSNSFGAVTSAPAMLLVPPTVLTCTEESLRFAMAGGGTVTFACDGTIILTNTITIATDTVLDGSGHQVTISGNNAVGVFHLNTNVTFTVINLTIANGRNWNSPDLRGAGIFNDGGTLNLQGVVLQYNAASEGGGVFNDGGTLNLQGVVLQNNTAWLGGGGVFNRGGTVSATNCVFRNNTASFFFGSRGGAVRNEVGVLNLQNCSFNSNTASGGNPSIDGTDGLGGAIHNNGTLHANACAFVQNVAIGGPGNEHNYAGGNGTGGAIYNLAVAVIEDSTFSGNLASGGNGGAPSGPGGRGSGGAIYDINSQCYLTNCTLALNRAANGSLYRPNGTPTGGGITTAGGVLVNTLLSANTPSNCSGTITDAGHNLSSDASCAFTHVGSLNNTDPKLGPLADNGGSTLTMALLPGSPAIDAGDNTAAPPTDQRGFPRPAGLASDIGAYEYNPPIVAMPPRTQTAEIGSTADFTVRVTGFPPPTYQWFFNGNVLTGSTNSVLSLSGIQASNVGAYRVVVSDAYGSVTSSPAMLNVIAAVERRPVPSVKLTGQPGSLLNLDYANALTPALSWTALGSVSLTSTSQLYFDLTAPLPPQRFYRAWQTGTPSVVPSLNLTFVPGITLTGNVGDSLRVDYINAIGPTDAWVTLDTVTLTNTLQLYFDVSAPGQPTRLYRIVPVP